MLNKCDPASAVARAENLRQSIFSRPIHLPSSQLTVSISLSLALSTDFPKCDVEELLHHADMALYVAKAAGRKLVRIAQPESVDSKSDLPDVVPDPGITTARSLSAAATRTRNPRFLFFFPHLFHHLPHHRTGARCSLLSPRLQPPAGIFDRRKQIRILEGSSPRWHDRSHSVPHYPDFSVILEK